MSSHLNYRREEKKWVGNNEVNNQTFSTLNEEKLEIVTFGSRKEDWHKYCEYFKQYPDVFVDWVKPLDSRFNFYFYQRVYLRIMFRTKEVFLTATRGSSKSFLEILAKYLKCIMTPNVKEFICAPGKEQASKIAQQNIEDIWSFFPMLKNEVTYFSFTKDYTKLVFTNQAKLDIVQIENSSRGGRRHGAGVEEISDPSFKENLFNEAVLPLMANNRIAMCKGIDPDELHKQIFYVTTAGTKQSFAYLKNKEVLEKMVEGKSSFCIGNGYELPCMHGQLDINFIEELQQSSNFNKMGFDREYNSVWTGSSDKSLVPYEDLVACRTFSKYENKHCGEKDVRYVLSYDVSRSEGIRNANCSLSVIKIIPKGKGEYFRYLVNLYCFEGTHFKEQAYFLKQKVEEFIACILLCDHNGLGKGLTDFLVLETGEYPPYAVLNDERYDKYKTDKSIPMVYALGSQNKETRNSDMINHFMNIVSNHKLNILMPEAIGMKDINTKKKINSEEYVKLSLPFLYTDILCEEIMNLEYYQNGKETSIKRISKKINQDKFSSLMYGLYWIYLEEQKNKETSSGDYDFVFTYS
jgi:hypothetical protein